MLIYVYQSNIFLTTHFKDWGIQSVIMTIIWVLRNWTIDTYHYVLFLNTKKSLFSNVVHIVHKYECILTCLDLISNYCIPPPPV